MDEAVGKKALIAPLSGKKRSRLLGKNKELLVDELPYGQRLIYNPCRLKNAVGNAGDPVRPD